MQDSDLIAHIDNLAAEEHELFRRESASKASAGDSERLAKLQVLLDQCWDLLRQRRARREFGADPDEAHIRDAKTVENYIG